MCCWRRQYKWLGTDDFAICVDDLSVRVNGATPTIVILGEA